MSRNAIPKLRTIFASLACFAAGLVVGRLLPVESGAVRDSVFSKPERASRTAAGVPVRSWVADRSGASKPPARLSEHPGVMTSEENLVQVPSALLAELSLADGIRSIDHPLISRDGRIEELLGITKPEKTALQAAWRDSREAVRKAEAAAVTSEEMEDGSVRLSLPDLTAQRQATARRCVSSVRGILGNNRGEAFLAVKQVQGAFASQGGNWSCIVAPESIGDGRWRFHMNVQNADGRRVWVGETIPNEIRHLTDAVGVVSSLNADPQDP